MSHTPGPWRVISGPIEEIIEGPSGYVATVEHLESASEAKAQARLIAAAPELLDLLEEVLVNGAGPKGMMGDIRKLVERIRNRGES